MPSHYPDCSHCVFYNKTAKQHRHCQKHAFVMPTVDWHTICADWSGIAEDVQELPFEPESNHLYYYSLGQGQLFYESLGHFNILNNMLISVSLRYDEQYGWVIFPRRQTQFFPAPQALVNVTIGGRRCKFQVVNDERNLATEIIPTEEGWSEQHHSRQIFMLYSVESPTLIYDWLRTIINVDKYIEDTIAPSVFAFLEIAGNDLDYALYADLLVYHKYLVG